MTQRAIRTALEDRLSAMLPTIPTAWDNAGFADDQRPTTAYQVVKLLPANPDNPTLDQQTIQDMGIFQVLLYYPKGDGSADAEDRAAAIRAQFPAGLELFEGGLKIRITQTPAIAADLGAPDRYIIPVSVRYQCFHKGV